tara:strand:+ start:239 stop:1396 length:1158 start_codon:yes stop_codon:yes gene_type:complete
MSVIYILTNTYFNNRDKDRFGIDFFISKKFKVVVIDVQDFTNPELIFTKRSVYKEESNLFVVRCSKFTDFKKTIKLHGIGIAIIFLSENIQSTKIIRHLKLNKIKIGEVHAGMIPSYANTTLTAKKIFTKHKELGFKNFLLLVYRRIYAKIFIPKVYDFLITSNYETSVKNYNIVRPKSIIEAHCMDYDLKLKHRNEKSLIEKKYVVFLDQDLLNHSDFVRMNKSLNISSEKYYGELNNFFMMIEKKLNYQVVIAAHPRVNIKNYKKLYNNREVIQAKTLLLIKHSEFAITNHSTAINFAVIYEKPIIFFTANGLINTEFHNFTKSFSHLLKQNLVNISDLKKLPRDIEINKKYYSDYKKQYIKNNNIEMLIWEIFYEEYLKKLD